MTTYVYETIPQEPGVKPRLFEIKQAMSDPPLTKHPESGEAIRRVLLGGYGVLSSAPKKSTANTKSSCCGDPGCCS
jgi:predicted nucleic acid-binding Zn ribbon protein